MNDAPLMISVSGLRGMVGSSLTPAVAANYAAAIGHWLKNTRPEAGGHPHVVLGRDSRPSGPMIEAAVVAGLLAVGCRVTTLGIVTTPGVAMLIAHHRADAGIVITASHNPKPWNGIKTIGADGAAPDARAAGAIIERFKQGAPAFVAVDDLQPLTHTSDGNATHVERVLEHIDIERVRRRPLKVVVDSVCGAGGPAAAMLLDALGVERVHLHAEPTGQFPHEPEPTRDNLVSLCHAVPEHGADLGFAQDPDADRLAIVDEKGTYIGEEYTLALAALHVLSQTPGPTVANLSTSRMLDDVAAKFSVAVHRTPVGEANVAAVMRQVGAVIGGEGNGGVIWPTISHVRDSIAAMALVLELLATRGQPLSQVVAEIPAYAIAKDKLPIQPGMADAAVAALQAAFADQKFDTQDGLRIDWPDRWVHVRPSNTEPILRLIAEARDEATATALLTQVRQAISRD